MIFEYDGHSTSRRSFHDISGLEDVSSTGQSLGIIDTIIVGGTILGLDFSIIGEKCARHATQSFPISINSDVFLSTRTVNVIFEVSARAYS